MPMRNSMRRSGGQAGVSLDHAALNLDGAPHGVHHAAELDNGAIASALDHASPVHRDRRIDEVAAQRAQPRERSLLVRSGKPAKSYDVGGQNRGKFSTLGHSSSLDAK